MNRFYTLMGQTVRALFVKVMLHTAIIIVLVAAFQAQLNAQCTADAGDIATATLVTDWTICAGDDLLDANGNPAIFVADYSAADENAPLSPDFSYVFLLANADGTFVDAAVSGDFDAYGILAAGIYTVYALSYDTLNIPNGIDDYVNAIEADADLNDVAQIQANIDGLCLDFSSLSVVNEVFEITIQQAPTIASATTTDPTLCATADGEIALFLANADTFTTHYQIAYNLYGNMQTTTAFSLQSTTGGGQFDSLALTGLMMGYYDEFFITSDTTTCTGYYAGGLQLSEANAPDPQYVSLSNPTTCGGNDGTFTLGNLITDLSYSVNYNKGSFNIAMGPYVADMDGQITLTNLSAGTHLNLRVTETVTGCTGGNMTFQLLNPSAPNVNEPTPPLLCFDDAQNANLNDFTNGITTDPGTFDWYDADPTDGGNIIADPTDINIGDAQEFYSVFTDATTNCTDTTTIIFFVFNDLAITPNGTTCNADQLAFAANFSVNGGVGGGYIFVATGDDGQDYTANIATQNNTDFTVNNLPNGVTVSLSLTDGHGCEASATLATANCCQADAGTPTITAAIEICEGEATPNFTATNTTPQNAGYSYWWLLTQDNTATGGTSADIANMKQADNTATNASIFNSAQIGEYCVMSFSFFGDATDLQALGYTSAQAILDAINANQICGDLFLGNCTQLTVNEAVEANDASLLECVLPNGFADFNLESADEQCDLTGTHSVTYHSSEAKAMLGTEALASPYAAANGTIVFARVFNSNTNCYEVSELTLNTMQCEVEISDPCSCRANPASPATSGNATNLDNGQFDDIVEVQAPSGQAWSIQTVNGLFHMNSPQPPAAPTNFVTGAAGEQLVETPNGDGTSTYTLQGIHIDATGYTITVTNGVNTLDMNNLCYYPTIAMDGFQDENCLFTPVFTITGSEANGGLADAALFRVLDENNAVVQTENGLTIDIDPMALGTGTYTVEFTFDAGAPGQNGAINDPGCEQTISQNFTIQTTPSAMSCNNNVNLSIGANCEATIHPDMILEGTYGCYDDYQVMILNTWGASLGDMIDASMIDQVYTVIVNHLPSGNSCWGQILVQDYVKPTFNCPIAPIQASCMTDFNAVLAPIAMDNCDPNPAVNMTNQSIDSTNPCTPTSVTQTFIATDIYGNQSLPCTQVIEIVSPTLPDFPENITWTCDQYALYPSIIEAEPLNSFFNDTDAAQIGIQVNPTYTGNILGQTGSGLPDIATGQYCSYNYTFSDDVLDNCGDGIKIIRTFLVINWCNSEVITTDINGDDNVQIINVMDVTAPIIIMDDFTVSANNYTQGNNFCSSNGFLPAANITDNCSDFTVQIFTPIGEAIYQNGVDGAQGGFIPSQGLSLGNYDVIYRATDACGNINELAVQVQVIDDLSPVTICDEITTVTLSNNGLADVFAITFDDGSLDNCGIQSYAARRMTDNCGIAGNTTFGNIVTFCCSDVGGAPIQIQFQVEDYFGNTNSCMVQVIVEDETPPAISCPNGQTIICDTYLDNYKNQLDLGNDSVLDAFGEPFAADNCGFNFSQNVTRSINNCGEGTITRTFTVLDNNGNPASSCSQIINVIHVSDWVVEFPADVDLFCENGNNPMSGDDFGEPTVFFDNCELIAISEEDLVFNSVPDACYKIFRTWTAVNWCIYDAGAPNSVEENPENELPGSSLDSDGDKDENTYKDGLTAANFPNANPDGIIVHTQIIKVLDNEAPEMTCPILPVYNATANCEALVTLLQPTVTDCSPNVTVTATSSLGAGFGPFDNVPVGIYTVTYTASDNCGNSSSCTRTFEVADNKPPTPYCIGGLVVELQAVDTDNDGINDDGYVELWASDFDAGSFDNCSDVTVSFSPNPNDIFADYTCDSIGFLNVYLWVTDEAGNQDVCITNLQIESVDNVCSEEDPTISGGVQRSDNQGVEDVNMLLSGEATANMMTFSDGTYLFEDLIMGYDYSVTPEKNDDHDNGVTTWDLVLMQQHVLNSNPFTDPYQLIAADANRSGSVTVSDIVTVKRVILGITPEYPNNTSWRFVPTNHVFPNPSNPWQTGFPETRTYNNLAVPVLNADFVAIKIGDINNSNQANLEGGTEERTNGKVFFEIEDRKVDAGETFNLRIRTTEAAKLEGWQFTLAFDNSLIFNGLGAQSLMQAHDIGQNFLAENQLTGSYVTHKELKAGEVLLDLEMIATVNGNLSDLIELNSNKTKKIAYNFYGDKIDIDLIFKAKSITNNRELPILYQNQPNPFQNSTVIAFYLPQAADVKITVFNSAGKVLQNIENQFDSGKQSVIFERGNKEANGILYYRLESSDFTAVQKMILIN